MYFEMVWKTIIMSNHQSMWDPILIGFIYLFRQIRIWAADILYQRTRMFSWFLTEMGFIRVNRDITDNNKLPQKPKVPKRTQT